MKAERLPEEFLSFRSIPLRSAPDDEPTAEQLAKVLVNRCCPLTSKQTAPS